MEVEEYERIAAVEDDHWWYRATRSLAADLLDPWLPRATRLLDAGCGPGGNGAWLADHGTAVGIDRAPEALTLAARRHPRTRRVQGSIDALPFPHGSFDVVLAVTVLYTVSDDTAAARELARVLARGGALLVVEPAFESLRRGHDDVVHARRRYRRRQLRTVFEAAGLHVRRATYVHSFLVPAAAGLAAIGRVRRTDNAVTSDVDRRGLDWLFEPLSSAERRFLTRRDLPVGTSVLVLATRE